MFETDVLGARGARPDGRQRLARVRHPRRPQEAVALAPVRGFLATSGDYGYYWSLDYARNHIADPRRGVWPADFASGAVKASSGLMADALSLAAFLVGRLQTPALLACFVAEDLFVGKDETLSRTSGFPIAVA